MGGIGWINVALVKKDVGAVMNRVMKLKFRDVLEICWPASEERLCCIKLLDYLFEVQQNVKHM